MHAFGGLAQELAVVVPTLMRRPPLKADTRWALLGEWACQRNDTECAATRKDTSQRINKLRRRICRDADMHLEEVKTHMQVTDLGGSVLAAPADAFRAGSRLCTAHSGEAGHLALQKVASEVRALSPGPLPKAPPRARLIRAAAESARPRQRSLRESQGLGPKVEKQMNEE